MNEATLREDIARFALSLFNRGYCVGSAGNISAKVDDGILITPTNSSFGSLDPAGISKLDGEGRHVGGDKPSKGAPLHQAFYATRPQTGAVVHLHSTFATAISCLADIDPTDCVPPLTPYVVMRVGAVPLLPYRRPGDPALGALIRDLGGRYGAVLLANHGPVVSGRDLASTIYAAEELEESAKLFITLRGAPVRMLTPEQIEELDATFSLR
jgi:ribulose-5-phosphate 4-epimerase/fuculose-1-phosphate aldolase